MTNVRFSYNSVETVILIMSLFSPHAVPPSIQVTPQSPVTIQFNQTITLQCTTDSIRDVQFEWFINEEKIIRSNVTHSFARLNATASALTITNISDTGFGMYTCIIDDGFYDPVNESVTIVESEQLYFVGGQTTVQASAINGSRLTLVCSVRGGVGSPIIFWVNGSSALHNRLDRVMVNRLSSGGLELIIEPILLGDAGQYSCTATDGVTFITRNFQVDIIGKSHTLNVICV